MYAANKFLLTKKFHKCSIKAIAAQLDVSHAVAKTEYQSVINKVSGEVSPGGDFTVNQVGIMNDVEVRQKAGGFSVPAGFDFKAALKPGTGKLIDYSIRNKAVKKENKHPLSVTCDTCA